MTLVSNTTGMRFLRGGTGLFLFLPAPARQRYGVALFIAALTRLFIDFFIKSLVFPNFQALIHISDQERHWVVAAFASLFLKEIPDRGI